MGHFKEIHLIITNLKRIPGVRVGHKPDTVFIPWNMEPTNDMKYLRDRYGYMIQTEIT